MRQTPSTTIKAVIFDFDGTLADSLEVFLKVAQELLGVTQTPSPEEIEEMRGMKSLEIMKKFDIKAWRLPKLLLEGRKAMAKEADSINLFQGIDKMLHDLKEDGYKVYVISTNSKPIISKVLRKADVSRFITYTDAGASITGKSANIRRLMKQRSLERSECVYVGDEVRDIEAARKAKIRVISVSWGFNSKKLLSSHNPDIIIDSPSEMIQALKQLS